MSTPPLVGSSFVMARYCANFPKTVRLWPESSDLNNVTPTSYKTQNSGVDIRSHGLLGDAPHMAMAALLAAAPRTHRHPNPPAIMIREV